MTILLEMRNRHNRAFGVMTSLAVVCGDSILAQGVVSSLSNSFRGKGAANEGTKARMVGQVGQCFGMEE
ncbi:hypothetical protein SLA2020_461050 [Shorea laevis]